MLGKKKAYLMLFLCFIACFQGLAQNKYRSLAIERTRYADNQTVFAGLGFSPYTLGAKGGYLHFIDNFLQVGGSVDFSQLWYASYKESIAVISLEGQYDLLMLYYNNVILSGLSRIGFERTFVTSETNIVLDRNYPFKVIPQLGFNADFYIFPGFAVYSNFTQGYVVTSGYMDRWRFRVNGGIKYFLNR